MNDVNRGLLDEVIQMKLEAVKDLVPGSDEEKAVFKQAMEAIDRDVSISKNDETYSEHVDKIEVEKSKLEIEKSKLKEDIKNKAIENDFKRKESKYNWIRWGVEIGVIYLLTPMLDKKIKEGFARLCMEFETSDSFTSTPGRSIKDFFRFKK